MTPKPTADDWLEFAQHLDQWVTNARIHTTRARLAHMLTEARREALAQAGELALAEFRKASE